MAQSQSVALRGLSFNVQTEGRENAPWVVFGNSLATNLTIWDRQAAALSDRFRILRYDQRGHGGTSVATTDPNIGEMGDDLIAILDAFGIDECIYVGLSMGVPTGLHLYDRQPHRVKRLVLSDGQAFTQPGGAQNWEARIVGARETGMEAVADSTVERWFLADFVAAGKAEKVRAMAAATPLEGYIGGIRALQSYAYGDVLEKIVAPTLLLVGQQDGKMPETMARMREAIPAAVLVEIADAGHCPNFEQPELFNRALLDFLT